MERNQNGYPVPRGMTEPSQRNEGMFPQNSVRLCPKGNGNMCPQDSGMLDSLALAYAYVPMQKFRLLYSPEKALARGTLFEELDLPLGVYHNGK